MLNIMWFIKKLDDNDFSLSLLNINEVKRYLDSLYMATGSNIATLGAPASINQILNMIYEEEDIADNSKFETVLNSQYVGLIAYYDFLDTFDEAKFKIKQPFIDKPCRLVMTRFNETPVKNINSMRMAVELVRPELHKYLQTKEFYGNEKNLMESYLNNLNVIMELKNIKTFLDFINKEQTRNITLYTGMPSDSRILYDEAGLHNYMLHSLTPNLTLADTSRTMGPVGKHSTMQETLDDYQTKCLTAYVLYRSILTSRLEYLNQIGLSKDFNNIPIYDIKKHCSKISGFEDFIIMLDYSTNRRGKSLLNMASVGLFAAWIKRQNRVGSTWTGDGELLVKMENCVIVFNVVGSYVKSCRYRIINQRTFKQNSMFFLNKLFSQLNITWLVKNFSYTDGECLGLTKDGIFEYTNLRNLDLILPQQSHDTTMNYGLSSDDVMYEFLNGAHTIEYMNKRYTIETLDTVAIRHYGLTRIYDILDLEYTDNDIISQLCGVIISSDPIAEGSMIFDKEELYIKFRSTDLYKKLIQDMKRRDSRSLNPNSFFWDNIISNMKTDSETAIQLADIIGSDSSDFILPGESKNLISKMMLYDIKDPVLLRYRSKLKLMSSEDQRNSMLEMIKEHGNDKLSLILSDDVGDYQNFTTHNFGSSINLVSIDYMVSFFDNLTDALIEGMKAISKNTILEKIESFAANQNILSEARISMLPFNDVVSPKSTAFKMTDPNICSLNIVIIMKLIDLIFDNVDAFELFSLSLKRTFMRMFPRLPIYVEEWKVLISNVHKVLVKKAADDYDSLPDKIKTKNRLRRIVKDKSIISESWDLKENKINFRLANSVPLIEDYAYLPIHKTFSHRINGLKEFQKLNVTIDEIIEMDILCQAVNLQTSMISEESLKEDLNVKFQQKSHCMKQTKKRFFENDGRYILALGCSEVQSAFQMNITTRNFIPIISDCLIPNMYDQIGEIYILPGSIINYRNTNLFLYMTDVSIPKNVSKKNNLRKLNKKLYDDISDINDLYSTFIILEEGISTRDKLNNNPKSVVVTQTEEINMVDIKKAIVESNPIPTTLNIGLNSTYSDDLIKTLDSLYKFSMKEINWLKDQFSMANSPFEKYRKLRQFIINKSSLEHKSFEESLKSVLGGALNNIDVDLNNLLNKKTKANYFLRSGGNKKANKARMYKLIDDKIAFKQYDDLTDGCAYDLMIGDVKITRSQQLFLSQSLMNIVKILDKDQKDKKNLCMFYKDQIENIPIDKKTNSRGEKIIEAVQNFCSTCTIDENSSDDYEYDEPESKPVYMRLLRD
jgi:flagellin-specific chaperone FliS